MLDGKQDIQNKRLITFCKEIDLEKVFNDEITSLSIIILYNKSFNEVKIEGLEMNEKKDIDEDIDLFTPQVSKYKMSQVILSPELDKEIKQTLLVLEQRELIYETWGFGEIEPEPKAILNFYGPSGTGKTMTANAIADYLDCKIMALNYSDIESKFVGDAPKNLAKAFERATKEEALLFFDEADSFLGKRITNVSSSSDQAVNSLRSQLLILLENFQGVVIFATNLIKNYDKAFESRIFKHLKFDLPDEKHRKLIITKSIPDKVPFEEGKESLSEIEIDELVQIAENFSGRHIKNSILNALTTAIIEKRRYLLFNDFKSSFEKNSQTIKDLSVGNNQISNDKKLELEKKIKINLEKENIIKQ